MNPALTTIQNDVRAAELRGRAERRVRRASKEIETAQAARQPARAPLLLRHGFFGREHGSHA